MKTRRYILLAAISAFFTQAHSQSVQWAPEAENPSKIKVTENIGYTDNNVFLLKTSYGKNDFYIDRYDLPDMKKAYTKQVWGTDDGTDKGKSLHMVSAYCLKAGVVVVAMNHDKDNLYAMQLRTDDGVLLDSRKVTLGDIENERKDKEYCRFAISKDRTTLLGYFLGRHSATIHVVAIDADLNIKWKKDIMPSFSNNDFDIIEVCSNDGDEIGLLTRIKDKGSDQKYRFVTVYYNHASDSKFETRMDLGGEKLIDGINFDMDDAGNPVAAGMYKNDGEKGLFGTFGFRIDAKTGKILASASTAFTTDFLTNFISERKADKGKGVPELKVNEIYMTKDNDIIVTSERFEMIEHTSGGGMVTTTYTEYVYRDVVLAKLDGKSCKTDWVSILPKKQTTINGFKASYGFTMDDNTIYIAFCDNRKNADMNPKVFTEDADKLKTADLDDNGKYLDMTLCTVDIASGNVDRKYLTRYKEDDSKLVFNAVTLDALPNTIFVYRGDKKTDQAGILTLH